MEQKIRRRVGFGSPVEEVVDEASSASQVPSVTPEGVTAPPAATSATYWRRQAILARIGVGVLFVAAAAGIWLVQDAEKRWKAAEAQLAQTKGYLEHTQQYEVDAILLGYDFPITVSSKAELVMYLTGKGKRILDREVPVAQQAAFIAALAADPAKPHRYVAKVPVDGGYEKTYIVQVTDYVYFRTP